MRRASSGRRIEITERDIEIFKLMQQYRYLRSTYIHAFVCGASETRFKERLGNLFHEGYLDRPDQQWQFAGARYSPAVYESGRGAERVLRNVGETVCDARTFPATTAHRQFLHSLLISEVLASIDLGIRANPHLRYVSWPEILERAPEQTRTSSTPFRLPLPGGAYLAPDGLFGIEYEVSGKRAYRFFALEADRGTMPVARSDTAQSSYLAKLRSYEQMMASRAHKTHLGISTLFVLTVTTNPRRLAEMVAKFDGRSESAARFLFKAVGHETRALNSPRPGLLFDPWERVGLPPLSIGESD